MCIENWQPEMETTNRKLKIMQLQRLNTPFDCQKPICLWLGNHSSYVLQTFLRVHEHS